MSEDLMPKYNNCINHIKGIEVNVEDNMLKHKFYKDKIQ
jgi:hypothetical protein